MVLDFSDPELFNPTYLELMDNDDEFLHMWGSASSGKSYFAAQREVIKSFDPIRHRRKTIVARKVYNTLRDSCYSQLLTVIYNFGIDDLFHTTTSPLFIQNKVTEVGFVFRGFDNIEKIKSIEGADRAWYEEATEGDNVKEFLQLRTRLRGFDKHQVTLTYNPTDEHHFINTQIHQPRRPGHFLKHTTYKDNLRMLEVDDTFGPFIEGTRVTDPNYYRVYGLGLWGRVTEGLMYTDFLTEDFPVVYGEEDIQFYGLDFGHTNPTALVAQSIRDAPFKKKLYNKLLIYRSGLDGPGLVEAFRSAKIRKDRVIIADSARPEMIKTLRDAGYTVRSSIKFAGSVLSGINDIRKYQIVIDPNSREMIKEIRNYQKHQLSGDIWTEEPAPRQVDHALDAMRYGVQAVIGLTRKPVKRVHSSSQSIFD